MLCSFLEFFSFQIHQNNIKEGRKRKCCNNIQPSAQWKFIFECASWKILNYGKKFFLYFSDSVIPFYLFCRIQRILKERKQKDVQRKQKVTENRKHLANVRWEGKSVCTGMHCQSIFLAFVQFARVMEDLASFRISWCYFPGSESLWILV